MAVCVGGNTGPWRYTQEILAVRHINLTLVQQELEPGMHQCHIWIIKPLLEEVKSAMSQSSQASHNGTSIPVNLSDHERF